MVPHSRVLSYTDVSLFKLGGGPMAPSSALPIGAERAVDAESYHEIDVSFFTQEVHRMRMRNELYCDL